MKIKKKRRSKTTTKKRKESTTNNIENMQYQQQKHQPQAKEHILHMRMLKWAIYQLSIHNRFGDLFIFVIFFSYSLFAFKNNVFFVIVVPVHRIQANFLFNFFFSPFFIVVCCSPCSCI